MIDVQTVTVATAAATVIGWFVRLERRFGSLVTREKHEEAQNLASAAVATQLTAIHEKLDAQNTASQAHRDHVTGQLHEIALDMVAVQTKVGVPRRRKITQRGE